MPEVHLDMVVHRPLECLLLLICEGMTDNTHIHTSNLHSAEPPSTAKAGKELEIIHVNANRSVSYVLPSIKVVMTLGTGRKLSMFEI